MPDARLKTTRLRSVSMVMPPPDIPVAEVRTPRTKNRATGSLEKKRCRDRRAQQALRNRRETYVQSLEEQLALLERRCRNYEGETKQLREENGSLRQFQQDIRQLLSSCDKSVDPYRADNDDLEFLLPDLPSTGLSKTLNNTHVPSRVPTPLLDEVGCEVPLPPSEGSPTESVSSLGPSPWEWRNLYHDPAGQRFIFNDYNLCLSRPDLVRAAPESPPPLELLYGSNGNFLADIVHRATRFWPCCDAERLAGGYLAYHFTKWLAQPTQANAARLFEFQKPSLEQLWLPHPCGLDFIFWPRIRLNLVRNHHRYDVQQVMATFCCSLKVRWPWGRNFLVRDVNDMLQIHPDFFDIFTRIDGWGLTDEFIKQYPELLDGLNMESVRYILS